MDTPPACCLLLARAPEAMDARKQVNEDLLELGSPSYGEGGVRWFNQLPVASHLTSQGVKLSGKLGGKHG